MYSIGSTGVFNTPVYTNCYVNTAIKMGTTQLHVYRAWYVGFSTTIVIFFVLIGFYTVCHVDHYVKVHPVQIKFWLIMANSASDHSFRHPPSVFGHDIQSNHVKNRVYYVKHRKFFFYKFCLVTGLIKT